MLQKLAMHDVQDIAEFFSLLDKCARAVEVMPGIRHLH
jgi:hypothetical protein